MITVIARRETTQMPADIEDQLWRQVKGAFHTKPIIFPESDVDMMLLLKTLEGVNRVFLEPTGRKPVSEIPDGDIVLIIGNTAMDNLAYSLPDERYAIRVPSMATHLYGVNAAAIALAIRYGQ